MYSWYCSHNCISQGARGHIILSMACRSGWPASIFGLVGPILALKSPHISVLSCGWMLSNTISSWLYACSSGIFRFVSDVAGGMYTFTILIL
jgi:hypothetical protein